ncbi:MAG: YhgE/Pip domain-containing protein, partial [Halobacteriota archaeon]
MTVKFLSLAVKGLKQALRDRRSLFFLLLFPVVFMIIFAFAFGSPSSLGTGTTPHKIAVINLDRGATAFIDNASQHINAGANFTALLGNVTYEGTDTHMFTLTNVSADQAQTLLKSRGLDAAITIPENFSQAVVSLGNASARTEATSDIGLQVINASGAQAAALSGQLPANATLPKQTNVTAQVIVEGDTGSASFGAAQGLIVNVLQQYESQIQATAIRQVDATLGQNQ